MIMPPQGDRGRGNDAGAVPHHRVTGPVRTGLTALDATGMTRPDKILGSKPKRGLGKVMFSTYLACRE